MCLLCYRLWSDACAYFVIDYGVMCAKEYHINCAECDGACVCIVSEGGTL